MAAATGATTARVTIVVETAADVAIAVAAAEIVGGLKISRSTDRLTSSFERAGSLIPLFSRTSARGSGVVMDGRSRRRLPVRIHPASERLPAPESSTADSCRAHREHARWLQ